MNFLNWLLTRKDAHNKADNIRCTICQEEKLWTSLNTLGTIAPFLKLFVLADVSFIDKSHKETLFKHGFLSLCTACSCRMETVFLKAAKNEPTPYCIIGKISVASQDYSPPTWPLEKTALQHNVFAMDSWIQPPRAKMSWSSGWQYIQYLCFTSKNTACKK